MLALCAVCVLASQSASAQPLSPLGSSGEVPQTLIDAGPALEAAEGSYAQAAEAQMRSVVQKRDVDQALRDTLEQLVAESKSRFSRAARSTVTELRGDGVLTVDELTRTLRDLRSDHLTLLADRLEAASRRIDPPPAPPEGEEIGSYFGRLLHYTLLERNPPRRWAWMLGFVAGGLLLAWGVSRVLALIVQRLRRGPRRRALADIVASVSGPLYLATAVAGVAAGLGWIWIPTSVEDFVWLLLRVSFAAAGYWLAWNLCGAVTNAFARTVGRRQESVDGQVVDVVRKGLRLFVTLVFVLFVTEVVFRSDIKGLLAGVGIAGLAISLAAQDTLKNVIASFTIFSDRPFAIGELIRYGEHLGTVEAIGFRSSRLRRFDGHLITIPNAEIISNDVENLSARPHIRRRFYLDLPYGTTAETMRKAQEILHDILDDRGCWVEGFDPKVEFVEFGSYSLRLLVEYRQVPPDYWGAFARDSRINLEILERFAEAGIAFAYPTQRIVLEGDGPGEDESEADQTKHEEG